MNKTVKIGILALFIFGVMINIFAQEEGKKGKAKKKTEVTDNEKMQKETEGDFARQSKGEIDILSLKNKYQNCIVKIEFTLIRNQEEIKMNPTKSERYYSDEEPPHGSGFFISESAIMTNAHVVENARSGSIKVKSPATGNVEFKAEVVGVGGSETIDLAILKLPEDEILRFKKRSGLDKIPYLQFGDSDNVKQSDPLAIFGYPQSSDELKIIQAKVTGRQYLKLKLGRFICGHQFIEVGPGGVVQPGNSGGPALNREGAVVGVPSRGSGYAFEQGWIIPSKTIGHFLDKIKNSEAGKKSLQIPKLGITLTENFQGTAVWSGAPEDCVIFELGVIVREVTPSSLAEDWGIKEKDIIVGFANKQKEITCALDFQGYRVTTGKMKKWPQDESSKNESPSKNVKSSEEKEVAKLHLAEMVLMSNEDDEIVLWYIRKEEKGIQKMIKKLKYKEPVPLPHLGTYEKPPFELWGDLVAQDFNDYNATLFEVPVKEQQKQGVLITFVEPNSLASRRGMLPNHRSIYGFSFSWEYEPATTWVIIESINGKPVNSLKELKSALREAEKSFEEKTKTPDYDPAKRIFMKERYVQIGYRTNTYEGNVLHLEPAFPIDEALECRKNLNIKLD